MMKRYIKTTYTICFLFTAITILIASYFKVMIPAIVILFILILKFIDVFAESFAKRLLSPLEEINGLLEGKQEGGRKDKIKTFKEVEPIVENINYLVTKLNYDFAEMEKTQQMRTDFVANVSHELKSPLTSIKGFAELILSGLITNQDKQRDYLARIVTESNRLLHIINDILYLSEVESVKINQVELENVSLDQVATNVIKSLEGLRAEKDIKLFITGTGSIKAVESDIWELIYNLVDNGIRYGKDRGFVQIKIISNEDKTTLIIQDNGIGIDQAHLPRIFERFYKEDQSRNRKGKGTGLGLSIVRNIVVKYGGVIRVESMKGNGTTFKMEFH